MKENIDEENQILYINKKEKENSEIKKENKKQNKTILDLKEEKKIRNSSFEILRIILMIFIAMSHIIFHTKSLPKLDDKNYTKIINKNYIYLRIISNYGKLGDILFIMISGYFSIKRLNFHYIKFILISSETYFYHYIFLFLSFKLKDKYKEIELLKQNKGSFYFPLTNNLGHWFTQNYLLLLIFMPYINTSLLSLNHEKYKALVILIIIFYCIFRGIFSIYQIVSIIFNASHLIKLILPYIIGGYIRLFDLEYKKFWKIFGILCFLLTIIFEIIFDNLAIKYNNYIFIICQNELSLNINSILLFFCSMGVICLFKDIQIYNKFINFISASVLGIYLIHANKNISPFIYNAWYKTNDYNEENFFIRYFSKVFLIFIVCLIIDIIRRYTIELLIVNIITFLENTFKNRAKYEIKESIA